MARRRPRLRRTVLSHTRSAASSPASTVMAANPKGWQRGWQPDKLAAGHFLPSWWSPLPQCVLHLVPGCRGTPG
ncbi:MAG: hypothetical protein ACRDQ9_16395 [Pseudonocardiaceae bacterium]